MRIVIDMQGAQTESRFRGIGRYSLSLAQAIVRNRGEHEIILALSGAFPDTIEPIRAAFDGILRQERIRVWNVPGPVRECDPGNDWRREVAMCTREAFLASLLPDVVHISSLFEGYLDDAVTSIGVFAPKIPTVVTLYDLIPLLNPETYLKPNSTYARYYQRKIEYLRNAKKWLAISESAAGEACDALAFHADAVVNISAACDAIFQPMVMSEAEQREFLTRFGITQPFVLYSGGADVRKNLHQLIRAFAFLPSLLRDAYQLVLVGKIPEGEEVRLRQTAKSAGLCEGHLLFTGYVTDTDLARFYNLCTVFVFPSLHEGFGLPVLEAMSCGAAVVGANATSIPEVVGRQDAMFDPHDEVSISQKLAEVLGDAAFRNELVAHGLERARLYSWDESARRAIAVFERIPLASIVDTNTSSPQDTLSELIRVIAATVPSRISDREILFLARLLNCNHPANVPRQLFVDVSELCQRDARTGVQRVTRSILKEFLDSPVVGFTVVPVYATSESPGYHHARSFMARFRGVSANLCDAPIDYQSGDIFLGLDLQSHVVVAQKRFLAALRRDGVRILFVVYDLLPVLMPHAFPPSAEKAHKAWLETVLSLDGAICISKAVADELAVWKRANGPKRLRPFRIDWFHLGADVENSLPTSGLPDNAKHVFEVIKSRPTFLMVGTLEPRKGQAQALGSFDSLWKQGVDVNLVIIGKQGWMVEELAKSLRNHPELNKRLFWLEGISDEYLNKIYAASACLIAASEGEGFGLPLIEAAQHKLPIIARDLPVFREVAGDCAIYFRGRERNDLASTISHWLTLYSVGQHPKSDAMPWLTWMRSAEQLLACIGIELNKDERSIDMSLANKGWSL